MDVMYLALMGLNASGYSAPHHSGIVGVAGDALHSPSDRSGEGSLEILEIVRDARYSTIIDLNRYGVGIKDRLARSWVGSNMSWTYNNIMYDVGKPAEINLFVRSGCV